LRELEERCLLLSDREKLLLLDSLAAYDGSNGNGDGFQKHKRRQVEVKLLKCENWKNWQPFLPITRFESGKPALIFLSILSFNLVHRNVSKQS
jgi:hypothetical protein